MKVFGVLMNLVVLVFFIGSIEDNQAWSRKSILLILLLFSINLFLVFYFRRQPTLLVGGKQPVLRHLASPFLNLGIWLNYVLIAAGGIVICVGVFERSWTVILLGAVGMAIAGLRVLVRRHAKKVILNDKG
jgi:hypothetical protein